MKLVQLFAEFNLAYHARLRLKYLLVLIALLIQRRSHCPHLVLKFLAARLELRHCAKDLSHEVKNEAPLSANSEAISASLKGEALHSKAKLVFKGRAKKEASSCEATLLGKAILALL